MIKKHKVIFTLIVLIVIILIIGGIQFHKSRYQDLYIYETNDTIIELFEHNIKDFNDYVDRFKNHTMWDSYYEKTGDSDFVNYKGFKKYTTDEEFEILDSFYQKYHPTFWGRKSLGFYAKSGHVRLIKDEVLTTKTQMEINKAKESGATIKCYDYGWICIAYPPSKTSSIDKD